MVVYPEAVEATYFYPVPILFKGIAPALFSFLSEDFPAYPAYPFYFEFEAAGYFFSVALKDLLIRFPLESKTCTSSPPYVSSTSVITSSISPFSLTIFLMI